MMTEQQIKEVLDGTLTYVDRDGAIVTRRVRRDYVADYHPRELTREVGQMKAFNQPFSEDEDRAIIAGLRTYQRLSHIADRLGRDRSSVWTRVRRLQKKGLLP